MFVLIKFRVKLFFGIMILQFSILRLKFLAQSLNSIAEILAYRKLQNGPETRNYVQQTPY